MKKEVCLTTMGLSRLGYPSGFLLKTDSAHDPIRCSRGQISFISPLISRLLQSDTTINEFELRTKNSSICGGILRSLMNGSSVVLTGDMSRTLYFISLELGNEELLSFVEEEITIDNVIYHFRIQEQMLVNSESELEFIASHFDELLTEEISTLEASEIDPVLSKNSLVISNEHKLFKLIQYLITNRKDGHEF